MPMYYAIQANMKHLQAVSIRGLRQWTIKYTSPMILNKITTSVVLKLFVKKFGHYNTSLQQIQSNCSLNVSKIFVPTNNKTLL